MATEQKVNQLIKQLTRATAKGELDWSPEDVPRSLREATDDRYHLFLAASYKKRSIAITERKFQDYSQAFDQLFWNSRVVLLILDFSHETVIWEYSEQSAALKNLFDLAKDSASNIDGLIDELIADDE